MKKTPIAIFLTTFALLTLVSPQSPISSAQGPKRLAILPFTMHAERDLTFLQEGIMDMLASRLAWKGEVEILEKGPVKKQMAQIEGRVDREKALEIGKALQAEYVIFGSLTVFGESVSIDARILDVPGSEELMTAFKQTKGMDEVIPTVNQFAMDINEKIMGRYIRPTVPVAVPGPETPAGPGGLAATGEDFDDKEVGHVQYVAIGIVSLDAGDVDGDGKDELVFVDNKRVYVYKWREKAFTQFKVIKEGWSPNHVYVSVGDVNGNGRAEIYVSNVVDPTISSHVLEWNGSRFEKIADRQPWFLKAMDLPGQGLVLLGQRRKTDQSFHGPVQVMEKAEKGFTPTGSVPLPRYGNVFNFAFVDFVGGGKMHGVVLARDEYLYLYGPDKKQEWRSESYYGGTNTFMVGGETTGAAFFLPSPIYITDVDEDGEKEVMVCKNVSKTRRLFERFRYFSGGSVHFLTWNQAGLSTKWTTRKQGGPIVGYRVFDADNDGLKELVVASVIRGARIIGKPRSQVVVYDLK